MPWHRGQPRQSRWPRSARVTENVKDFARERGLVVCVLKARLPSGGMDVHLAHLRRRNAVAVGEVPAHALDRALTDPGRSLTAGAAARVWRPRPPRHLSAGRKCEIRLSLPLAGGEAAVRNDEEHVTVLDATLAGMEVTPGCLRVSLVTGEGLTSVDLPLDAAAHNALGPLLTLHGHHHRCFGHVDVGVGLLLRTVDVLSGALPRLVARPDADPPLWLRLPDAEVALTTLDACCLLCSQRLPITLDRAPSA